MPKSGPFWDIWLFCTLLFYSRSTLAACNPLEYHAAKGCYLALYGPAADLRQWDPDWQPFHWQNRVTNPCHVYHFTCCYRTKRVYRHVCVGLNLDSLTVDSLYWPTSKLTNILRIIFELRCWAHITELTSWAQAVKALYTSAFNCVGTVCGLATISNLICCACFSQTIETKTLS